MAHRLDPAEGSPAHDPHEVARLPHAEFAHVEDLIRQLGRMQAPSGISEEHRCLLPTAVRANFSWTDSSSGRTWSTGSLSWWF
ncbi:MAG TPA: hypothetical protein VFT74_06855 [Isosphaeraceae bacterium]|nr:hypothetical protein [Isosphaeraceae bacterium]